MSHQKAFEALNRTLQDLHNNKRPMGGVTMVLSGNFWQTLPVTPQGARADEVHTCISKTGNFLPKPAHLGFNFFT